MVLVAPGYRLLVVAGGVRLGGAPRPMSPMAFALLCPVIDGRPRVVLKGELMQALWSDALAQEANVPILIREARVAIDDAEAASVIETHHRVGYASPHRPPPRLETAAPAPA